MSPKELVNRLKQEFDPDDSWEGRLEPYYSYGDTDGGAGGFFHQLFNYKVGQSTTVKGIGVFTTVETESKWTESGDIDAILVFKLKPEVEQPELFTDYEEAHYRVKGQLDSWAGGPWDLHSLERVKPVEKTVTVWESV